MSLAKQKPWDNKWTCGAKLSQGGQGFTYYASKRGETENKYCLKVLKNQNDPERRARMLREVAALQTLNHQGIAKFADSNASQFETANELYLVTELVVGETLPAPVEIEEASRIVLAVLDALKYCHEREIVHRDIKPDNIVLRAQDQQPILVDFGLSFNEDVGPSEFDTATAQNIGPRNFIVLPEQAGGSSDQRSRVTDITQTVGLLFYMLTKTCPAHLLDQGGQRPHERSAARQALSAYSEHQRTRLKRIFDVGFRTELNERWQSASALQAEIEILLTPPESQNEEGLESLALKAKEEYIRTPTRIAQLQLSKLFNAIQAWFEVSNKTIISTWQDVISASGEHGVNSPATGVLRLAYRYHDKLDANVNLRFEISAKRVGSEVQIQSLIEPNYRQPQEGRKMKLAGTEPLTVSTILLSDPEAETLAYEAITAIFRTVIKEFMLIK